MKNLPLSSAILMLALTMIATATLMASPKPAETRKLIWAEEFDGNGLPDPNRWGYEEGYVRNKEMQYYTHADLNNAKVQDGILTITARAESPAKRIKHSQKKDAPVQEVAVTSASINTLGKFAFKYGRLEVRAKLPQGQGVWPAIWMMGVNRDKVSWPNCGEIDIMEYVWGSSKTIWATCHWAKADTATAPTDKKKRHISKGGNINSNHLVDQWHVYAMEWSEEKIDFYFDDSKIFTYSIKLADQADGNNPFRKEMFLLINLAIGGSWGGDVDPSTLPATYQIDYVRYYK